MTLQNGMLWKREVRLYCDTAWLSLPDAIVRVFASKAIHGTNQPFAIVGSFIEGTDAKGMEPLARALGARFGNLGPQSSADVVEACRDWLLGSHAETCRLLIGCNYPETGPELLVLAADDLGFARPFEPVQLASYVSSENDSAECQEAMALGFTQARMLAVIEAQRRNPLTATGGRGTFHGIGGELVEIRVKPSGVDYSVARTWPDRVGERIAA